MKIIIAPDSYKESLSAIEVAFAIERGFKKALPWATYLKVPMADGGEGTVHSLVKATKGSLVKTTTIGPLGKKIKSFYGILGDGEAAVIEVAAACGLQLVAHKNRNPLKTTSFGVGQLILQALDQGISRIVLGLGGSATNDGGSGMAQALGAQLLDKEQKPIPFGGGSLDKLKTIDLSALDPRLAKTTIEVALDVNNPLCGSNGASLVFAAQKGATPMMARQLDKNLAYYADCIQSQLGTDIKNKPGAGAAGGLGASLMAFFSVNFTQGSQLVMNILGMDKAIVDAQLIITGEGRLDDQTFYGKAPIGLAQLAKQHKVPIIAIAGSLKESSLNAYQQGIEAVFSCVNEPMSLAHALKNAASNIEATAENIARVYALGLCNSISSVTD